MSPQPPLRKLVTVTPEMAKRLDDYRYGSRIPSESEALRQLIGIGLDSVENKQSEQAT